MAGQPITPLPGEKESEAGTHLSGASEWLLGHSRTGTGGHRGRRWGQGGKERSGAPIVSPLAFRNVLCIKCRVCLGFLKKQFMREAVHKEYLEDTVIIQDCMQVKQPKGVSKGGVRDSKNCRNFVRSLLQQCQQLEISFKYSHTSEGPRSLADVLSCTDKAAA